MSGEASTVRVGFLGASSISRKVWAALHAAGLKVTLVGSRDREKALAYIAECTTGLSLAPDQAPEPATYDEVVTADQVDVVYISLPVTEREGWVLKCAANGKHVVCEKPHPSSDALRAWSDALTPKHLLFMDGTMFSHGDYIQKVVESLPRIGTLRYLSGCFCFLAQDPKDIRMNPEMEPMGALGDLGWYCVRFMLHAMKFAMPTAVVGRIVERAPNGAILSFSGELTFVDEETKAPVTGSFFSSFTCAAQNEFVLAGTTGTIEAPDLILPLTSAPTQVTIVRHVMEARGINFHVGREEEVVAVPKEKGHDQETQMWRDVAACLRRDESGALVAREDEAAKWFRVAWMTQCILDKLLESALSCSA
ncbi:oxidoreductase-like protein [Strigomonas culicis]|uniref:Oxidoreductase-like protein n=1 Tax=Strigomonas culicis TaxID=28005 RepID=S9W5R2_9TRYP|nr:oxidoreductase-like protein [Strigomonas culicis]|eukprot:EPY31210.1 oxidoreductase-like protein [Strigomonas culicis]